MLTIVAILALGLMVHTAVLMLRQPADKRDAVPVRVDDERRERERRMREARERH